MKNWKKCVRPLIRATLSFWKFLQVLKIFCRAQNKIHLEMPWKKFCANFFFGKFWKFSKSKQRWHSEGRLCLDLENFQNFPKKFFAQNVFSGHFKKNFFGALQKISNTCKKFQKVKVAHIRGHTPFFRFFVFVSRIGTLKANGIRL